MESKSEIIQKIVAVTPEAKTIVKQFNNYEIEYDPRTKEQLAK